MLPRLALDPLDPRVVPTIFAVADSFAAPAGRVLSVSAPDGVLTNDFSDAPQNAVLAAFPVGPVRAVTAQGAVVDQRFPQDTLQLEGNGSFTLIVPGELPANVTALQFDYGVRNLLDDNEPPAATTVTVRLTGRAGGFVAAGADAGGEPRVQVYEAGTGLLKYSFLAYEAGFTGGVRVAVGDVTGDGVDDIVTAPGAGGSARIRVFNGVDLNVVLDAADVFGDPNFRGGAYVAVGDVDGNRVGDVVVGAGEGGAPRVIALGLAGPNTLPAGRGAVTLADFFAFEPQFRNGVRVAAGDTDGDGRAEVVTTPGFGGGPRVRVFDYGTVTGNKSSPAARANPTAATAVTPTPADRLSFFAADPGNRDGLFVAAADTRGDGKADVVVGSGAAAGAVGVYDGRTGGLVRQFLVPIDELPPGAVVVPGFGSFGDQALNQPSGSLIGPNQAPGSLVPAGVPGSPAVPHAFRGGVRVAGVDFDADGLADIVTGTGPGAAPLVRVFDTRSGTLTTTLRPFDPGFLGGVNVGG